MNPIPYNPPNMASPYKIPADPETFPDPRLFWFNQHLISLLGLDPVFLVDSPQIARLLSGQVRVGGFVPFCYAYSGHQFGHFSPSLGDGRAHTIFQAFTDGRLSEIQTKGSGRTPFSRRGDGKAVLGPMLREVLVSEYLAAVGVPTTRALGVVTTGETVQREMDLPGAVLARVAQSHIRVGTLEYFAARQDIPALRARIVEAVALHDPDLLSSQATEAVLLASYPDAGDLSLAQNPPGQCQNASNHTPDVDKSASPIDPNFASQFFSPVLAEQFYTRVVERQARLIAEWMALGFVHGVMNTDNMALSGQSIDFGPCAFLDEYDPHAVWSSIDHHSRYAYQNQPAIARWNLSVLAQTVAVALNPQKPEDALQKLEPIWTQFESQFAAHREACFAARLGVSFGDLSVDSQSKFSKTLEQALQTMAKYGVDFTQGLLFLRGEEEGVFTHAPAPSVAGELTAIKLQLEDLKKNPSAGNSGDFDVPRGLNRKLYYVPRNHAIEAVITSAHQGDVQPFLDLLQILQKPFERHPNDAIVYRHPEPQERVGATFCGT